MKITTGPENGRSQSGLAPTQRLAWLGLIAMTYFIAALLALVYFQELRLTLYLLKMIPAQDRTQSIEERSSALQTLRDSLIERLERFPEEDWIPYLIRSHESENARQILKRSGAMSPPASSARRMSDRLVNNLLRLANSLPVSDRELPQKILLSRPASSKDSLEKILKYLDQELDQELEANLEALQDLIASHFVWIDRGFPYESIIPWVLERIHDPRPQVAIACLRAAARHPFPQDKLTKALLQPDSLSEDSFARVLQIHHLLTAFFDKTLLETMSPIQPAPQPSPLDRLLEKFSIQELSDLAQIINRSHPLTCLYLENRLANRLNESKTAQESLAMIHSLALMRAHPCRWYFPDHGILAQKFQQLETNEHHFRRATRTGSLSPKQDVFYELFVLVLQHMDLVETPKSEPDLIFDDRLNGVF